MCALMTDRERLEALRAFVSANQIPYFSGAVDVRVVLAEIDRLLAEPIEIAKSQPEHKWIACGGCARLVPEGHICEGKD